MKVHFLVWFVLSGIFMRMYGGKIDTKQIVYLFNNTDYTIWATSELKKKGRHYSVKNLLDGDITTVWATRENGGVGEGLVVFRRWNGIYIVNGFSKTRELYQKNNRAKEINVAIYRYYYVFGITGGTVEAGPPREALLVNPLTNENVSEEPLVELLFSTNITLRDEYLYTNKCCFPINYEEDEREIKEKIKSLRLQKGFDEIYDVKESCDYFDFHRIGYVVVLTIQSIYKGTQYNDLCISEIGFWADDK